MISSMRAPIVWSVLLVASAATPAFADTIYKWVDDQGTMHYSNAKPADSSRRAEVLSQDHVSVIPSEPAAVRAAAVARAETDYLARRVDTLERELAAQRQAAYAASLQDQETMQASYVQGYGMPYVVYGAPIVGARSVRGVHNNGFRSVRGITGVTAGNLVTFPGPVAPRAGRRFR